MGELPKCTSWLGHKFEPRTSSEAASLDPKLLDTALEGAGYLLTSIDVERIIKAFASTSKTYERDICVRCGATIEPSLITKAEPL